MPKGSKPKKPYRAPTAVESGPPQRVARPWAPMIVFAWTLLNGSLFGGVWAVMNTRRLGLHSLFWPTMLMAAVGFAFPIVIIHRFLGGEAASPHAFTWQFIFRIAAAYFYLMTQREPYWDYQDAGGKGASPLWPTVTGLLLFPWQAWYLFSAAE
jgi:hypothetical protein